MAAHAQSNVFWLSYQPAELETATEFVHTLSRVLPGKAAFFGAEDDCNGQSRFEVVICTPTRVRVSTVIGELKWKRRGARGRVCNAKWPAPGETARSFLHRWADATSKRGGRLGSRTQLYRALDGYHEKARERMKSRRVSRRPCVCRRKRPLSGTGAGAGVSTVATAAAVVATPTRDASVQVDSGCDPSSWSAHSFADFDQLPRWYSSARLSFLPCGHVQKANSTCIALACEPDVPAIDIDVAAEQLGISLFEDSLTTFDCDLDWTVNLDMSMDLNMDVNVNVDWNTDLDLSVFDVLV